MANVKLSVAQRPLSQFSQLIAFVHCQRTGPYSFESSFYLCLMCLCFCFLKIKKGCRIARIHVQIDGGFRILPDWSIDLTSYQILSMSFGSHESGGIGRCIKDYVLHFILHKIMPQNIIEVIFFAEPE